MTESFAMDSEKTWFLRNDKDIFGPETKECILEWAKMGRIRPGQELSNDSRNWTPVTDVPFLDLRWSIDIGDGMPKGPFHKEAAEALLKSGRLPPSAKLVEARPPFEAEIPHEEAAPADTENVVEAAASSVELDEQQDESSGDETHLEYDMNEAEDGVVIQVQDRNDAGLSREIEQLKYENGTLKTELSEVKNRCEEMKRTIEDLRSRYAAETVKAADFEKEAKEGREALTRALEENRVQLERAGAEARAAAEEVENTHRAETENQARLHAEALKRLQDDAAAAEAHLKEQLKAEMARAQERHREDAAAIASANARAEAAAAKTAAAEAEYAKLFSSANKAEESAREQIADLTAQLKRVPPDAASAAQTASAIYDMMRAEIFELSEIMERERKEAEASRAAWIQRSDRMLARRQELQRRIGSGISDMTRRAVVAHVDDPQVVRLRRELEKLTETSSAAAIEAKRKIEELEARVKIADQDNIRLRSRVFDADNAANEIQTLREDLQRREKELLDLREGMEEERRQFAVDQQVLLDRLNALETGTGAQVAPESPAEDSKTFKFPSWMKLKG